jgi:hypothetical protein
MNNAGCLLANAAVNIKNIISENIIKLKPKSFYYTIFQNAIFTFTRK